MTTLDRNDSSSAEKLTAKQWLSDRALLRLEFFAKFTASLIVALGAIGFFGGYFSFEKTAVGLLIAIAIMIGTQDYFGR